MTFKEKLFEAPQKVNPAVLEGVNTCFHFILDGEDGGNYTAQIIDGQLTTSEGLSGEPKCTVRAKAKDLNAIINGEMNPMMAVMMGKIKFDNQSEILKFAKVFGFM